MHSNPFSNSSYIPAFDIWKFFATISILLVHSYLLFDIDGGGAVVWICGHFAVELFFLVTGFLFAKSVYKDPRPFSVETIGTETWSFLGKKIQVFLPYYLFGFLSCCALRAIYAPRAFVHNILPLLPLDVFLLVETGIPTSVVQGISWYLSAMLMSLFLLYPAFRFRKNLFSDWLAPIVSLLLLGLLFDKFHTCAPPFLERIGGIPSGFVRAIAEISLGVFAFRVSSHLQNGLPSLPVTLRRILSLIGFLAPTTAFVVMGMMKSFRLALLLVFLFFLFVSIAGTGLPVFPRCFSSKTLIWLSRFSLSLFLTHTAVRLALLETAYSVRSLHVLFAARDLRSVVLTLILYLTCSILFAMACMAFSGFVQKHWRHSDKSVN